VNVTSLAFELILLDRMNGDCQGQILERINLSTEDADQIRRQCKLRYTNLFKSEVKDYEEVLGGTKIRLISSNSNPPELWETRRIDLMFWPSMEWEFVSLNDRVLTGYFRNKNSISEGKFDPELLRPNACCRDQLESMALHVEFIGGWSEQLTFRFDFLEGSYEGYSVFDLLQNWKKLGPV
jgi:hypothetical protein